VHEALEALAQAESRLAKWWECATFGSFSEAEIADTLHLTDRSVRRD